MVDTQLSSATGNLVGLVENFDVVSLVEGVTGLGIGLFSAEFVASLASGMVSGQSNVVKFIVEVLAKAVVTGGFAFAYSMMSSPLLAVIMGMAAVGSATSIVLQIIDSIAQTGAKLTSGQSLTGGAPTGGNNASVAGNNASVATNSFSPSESNDGESLLAKAARGA